MAFDLDDDELRETRKMKNLDRHTNKNTNEIWQTYYVRFLINKQF